MTHDCETARTAPAAGSRFRIDAVTPPYTPQPGEPLPLVDVLPSTARGASGERQLLLTRNAVRTIFAHIGWGDGAREPLEQGGLLLGYAIETSMGEVQGVIAEAVPGEAAHASGVYLHLDHDSWWKMIAQADALAEAAPENRGVLGWYHTHPGSLDVFMSSTDRNTQRTLFRENWHFAIVLNPHRRIWRAYSGPDARECLGFMERR